MAKSWKQVGVHKETWTGLKKISEKNDMTIAEVIDSFVYGMTFTVVKPPKKRRDGKFIY